MCKGYVQGRWASETQDSLVLDWNLLCSFWGLISLSHNLGRGKGLHCSSWFQPMLLFILIWIPHGFLGNMGWERMPPASLELKLILTQIEEDGSGVVDSKPSLSWFSLMSRLKCFFPNILCQKFWSLLVILALMDWKRCPCGRGS